MSTAIHTVYGLGLGYDFSLAKNKEDEIAQGKNYILAAPYQAAQAMYFGAAAMKSFELIQKSSASLWMKLAANIGPILYLPYALIAGAVRQGVYNEIIDEIPVLGKFLPKIGKIAASIMRFTAEHMGDILRVAMVVCSVACIYFGQLAIGLSMLSMFVYREIDNLGFVPRKVSLFVELYMPIVSAAAIVAASGILIAQVLGVITILSSYPPFQKYLQHKIDSIARSWISIKGPSLAEFEAPITIINHWDETQLNSILDADEDRFEINPSHCSKWAMSESEIAEDSDFDHLALEFQRIDWDPETVRLKLKTDDRFIDLLQNRFPDEDLRKNFDECLKKSGIDPIGWVRTQFQAFIEVIKGDRRAKGEQKDVDTAIQNLKKVLAQYKKIENPIEKQDILLKLAVEAGDYCARGINRTVGELFHEHVAPIALECIDPSEITPSQQYELKLLQALQNARLRIIQSAYEKMAVSIRVPNAISKDVHGFDIYRTILSLGFYPLTSYERNDFETSGLIAWEQFSTLRNEMLDNYYSQVDNVVHEVGEQRFTDYIREKLSAYPKLLDKFSNQSYGSYTNERFHRLLLVMTGVLRYTQRD